MTFEVQNIILERNFSQIMLCLKEKNFNGQFQILSSQGITWQLYFYLGRIIWITGGINITNSWHRDLNRFFSDLDDQNFTCLFQKACELDRYLLLLSYLNQKLVHTSQIKIFLQNKLEEVFFDTFQHETYHSLKYNYVPDSNKTSSILRQPLVLINIAEFLQNSQKKWSRWLKAGLGIYSPHFFVKKKSSSPKLSNLSPQLLSLLDGNKTLKDISLLMETNLEELSIFLIKYAHQGCLQLIEPSPKNYFNPHQFNQANPLEIIENNRSEDDNLSLITAINCHPQIAYSLGKISQQVGSRLINIDRSWEAIPKLVTHPPDLIFLSGDLSVISGYEILSQLAKVPHLKNIPLIYLTNNLWDRFRSQSFSNVRAHLSETATPNLIFKIVQKLLSQAERTSASHFVTKYRGIPYIKNNHLTQKLIAYSSQNKTLQFRGASYQTCIYNQKEVIINRLNHKIDLFIKKQGVASGS